MSSYVKTTRFLYTKTGLTHQNVYATDFVYLELWRRGPPRRQILYIQNVCGVYVLYTGWLQSIATFFRPNLYFFLKLYKKDIIEYVIEFLPHRNKTYIDK